MIFLYFTAIAAQVADANKYAVTGATVRAGLLKCATALYKENEQTTLHLGPASTRDAIER